MRQRQRQRLERLAALLNIDPADRAPTLEEMADRQIRLLIGPHDPMAGGVTLRATLADAGFQVACPLPGSLPVLIDMRPGRPASPSATPTAP